MFILLLAVFTTLPLLQQQQQQELTSSLLPLHMLLLLTVLSPTMLFFETADEGVTSDFKQNYLRSSCYKTYCLDVSFTAVSH